MISDDEFEARNIDIIMITFGLFIFWSAFVILCWPIAKIVVAIAGGFYVGEIIAELAKKIAYHP